MRTLESEWELEGEFEDEYEGEFEDEYEFEGEGEGEFEGEEFFGRLAGLARRAIQSPTLRRIASGAARGALSGGWRGALRGGLSAVGGARGLGNLVGGLIGQGEYEDEAEWEEEAEAVLNPIRRTYPDAMMEHMGHAAATARNEAEAEAFLGSLIPMAARLIPRIAPAVMRVAPTLVRGVANVGRTLLRNPAVRPLVQAVPGIVRGTVRDIAGQVARGRPLTGQTALRTLARNTYRTLSSPQRVVQTVRRARAVDRAYHRTPGAAIACRCNRPR